MKQICQMYLELLLHYTELHNLYSSPNIIRLLWLADWVANHIRYNVWLGGQNPNHAVVLFLGNFCTWKKRNFDTLCVQISSRGF